MGKIWAWRNRAMPIFWASLRIWAKRNFAVGRAEISYAQRRKSAMPKARPEYGHSCSVLFVNMRDAPSRNQLWASPKSALGIAGISSGHRGIQLCPEPEFTEIRCRICPKSAHIGKTVPKGTRNMPRICPKPAQSGFPNMGGGVMLQVLMQIRSVL